MSRVREEIEIAAPPERIWAVVHGDIRNVPRWSSNVARTEVVGGGSLRVGSELLYVIKVPAGTTVDVHLTVRRCEEFQLCCGTLRSALGSGTWSWTYRADRNLTNVAYEVQIKAPLALRLVAPLLERQASGATRKNLEALKRYVESSGPPLRHRRKQDAVTRSSS